VLAQDLAVAREQMDVHLGAEVLHLRVRHPGVVTNARDGTLDRAEVLFEQPVGRHGRECILT
jgi:hypothetical protein